SGFERAVDDVEAVDAHHPAGRSQKSREDPQSRALTGAVRSEKADDLAFADAERDVANRDHAAVVLGQVLDLDHRSEAGLARGRAAGENQRRARAAPN